MTARRNARNAQADDSAATGSGTATIELPATPTTEEPTVTDTTTTDAPQSDLTADVVVEVPATDETPEGIIAAIVAAYVAADVKGKAAVRKVWADAMADAVRKLDLAEAQFAQSVLDAIKAAGSTKAAAAPVNPVELITVRVRDLLHAALALADGRITPDGLEGTWTDDDALSAIFNRVASACNDTTGFAYDGPLSEAGTKLAAAKVGTGTRSGKVNDIPEVIRRAFAQVPAGTVLKISEVAREGAPEGGTVSQGAIAANMFGGKGTDGFEGIEADTDGPRRIRSLSDGADYAADSE